jgi:alpha-tubulin suppressor-like RCC1 family protein
MLAEVRAIAKRLASGGLVLAAAALAACSLLTSFDGLTGGAPNTCGTGTTFCRGTCVNTSIDVANCGACGRNCGFERTCVEGVCRDVGDDGGTSDATVGDAMVGDVADAGGDGARDAADASGDATGDATIPDAPSDAPTDAGAEGGGDADAPVSFDAAVPMSAVGVCTGAAHTCAVVDGGVNCWGLNTSSQLGVPWDSSAPLPNPTAVTVSGVTGVVALACGSLHTCALTADGHVWCWGDDGFHQLGKDNGTSAPREAPVVSVAAIGTGDFHTCAVTTSGDAYCWGKGDNGQIGDGMGATTVDPTKVPLPVAMRAIGGGTYHTCALAVGGDVYCWGNDSWGQLGDGKKTQSLTPVAAVALPSSGIKALAVGGDDTCVIDGDASALCVGIKSGPIPRDPGLGKGVGSVGVSYSHLCATVGGVVSCWGSNVDGELGDGTHTPHSTPAPVVWNVPVPPAVTTVTVSGGVAVNTTTEDGHSCALGGNGLLVCWGSNDFGQLGDGTTKQRTQP